VPNSSKPSPGPDVQDQLGAETKLKGELELKAKEDQLIEALRLALITAPAGPGIPGEVCDRVCPGVWAVETPSGAERVLLQARVSRLLIKFFFKILQDS